MLTFTDAHGRLALVADGTLIPLGEARAGRRTDDPLTAQAAAELAARIREQFAQRCSRAPRAEVGGEGILTDLLTLAQVLATTGPTFFRTLATSARRRAAVCPELAAEALLVAQDYEERAARLEAPCRS